jgi:predicted ABC-type exoprotein transport system permease subunit
MFGPTRAAIERSTYWLIAVLLIALLLVVAKPLVIERTVTEAQDSAASWFNSTSMLVVLFSVLVLADVTQQVSLLRSKTLSQR